MANTEGEDILGPTFPDNTHILDNYVCAGVKQIFNGIVTPNDSNANKNNIRVTYKIYDGNNTLLNTINTTTNNTGGHELQYIFPHKGNYTIIASVGDDTASVSVSVESLVDQITLSSSSNSVIQGNHVTLIAEVRSSTGDVVVGADVVFQISRSVGGSTSTDTVTTETSSSGEARATYTYPGGTCHVKAIVSYGIDSNESSSITITEASALFDGITLTSDKDILSYNGGNNPDSATLTAQLTLNGANASVSGETVLFSAQKQGKTFTASNFSDIENISTITNANNNVHIESFDASEMGLIVYDEVFGTYDHITRFTIENFETEDVGYICAVRNNTPVNSFIELSDGDFELITYYQSDIISVYKDGDFVGNINLGIAGSTYQIGFYLSDTRMNLVDFNDAEYLGSNVTDSSGKATVSYTSKGAGDLYIKSKCVFLTKRYEIQDTIKYGFKNIEFDNTIPPQMTITDDSLTIRNAKAWKYGNSQTIIPSSTNLWEISFNIECTPVSAMRFLLQSSNASGTERLYIGVENGEYYGSPHFYVDYNNSNSGGTTRGTDISFNGTTSFNVKIVRTDVNSAQIYVNEILKHTLTNISWLSDDIRLSSHMWEGSSNTNGKSVITNFKVKPL